MITYRMTRSTTVNSASPAVGVDFGYTYDANGNIESQTYYHRTSTPANGFGYDNLNRLTTANYLAGTAGTESFNYDLLGNRDSTTDSRTGGVNYTYASNWINEYTDITPASFDPDNDAAGNLIQDKSGYKYAYDYENRLTQITRQDNTVVATFEYDALGRRIEVELYQEGQLVSTVHQFYNDQQIVLKQWSGSPGQSMWFVYGNYIDEVLYFVSQISTYTRHCYVGHDHLYSPSVLFDDSGDVIERYEYDVYGACRILDSGCSLLSSSQYANPYTFTGRELDLLDLDENDVPRLKLMYYRARYYDPQTGRFLQRDPLRYIDGMNLYEYVQSMPLTKVDPSGMTENLDIGEWLREQVWDWATAQIKEELKSWLLNYVLRDDETYYEGDTSCSPFKILRIVQKDQVDERFRITVFHSYLGWNNGTTDIESETDFTGRRIIHYTRRCVCPCYKGYWGELSKLTNSTYYPMLREARRSKRYTNLIDYYSIWVNEWIETEYIDYGCKKY